MAKKTSVLARINLQNTGTLIDLYQGHSAMWDVRSREYRNQDIFVRVAFAAVRHFVAVNAKGRLLSPNATIVSENIVFLCDLTVFKTTRFQQCLENIVSENNVFRAWCNIAFTISE